MPAPTPTDIRELILTVAREQQPKRPIDASLQEGTLFREVSEQLRLHLSQETEQEILTQWHELMRTGYFAWGFNLNNPNPPFFHITDRGHRAVERLSRDPGNPVGYLRHLTEVAELSDISRSYLGEGLDCFVAGLYKAAAVMVGAASESQVLELRDITAQRLAQINVPEPKGLGDWRVKTVLDSLHHLLDSRKGAFPKELREEFEAYWLAFAQQIRTTRNDAGHPSSIDPVREESVHASFLVFPELARLSCNLSAWVRDNFK